MCGQVVRANGTRVVITKSASFDGRAMYSDIFTPPLELFAGDTIITTCIYNTTDRSTDLVWGEGLKNEMCNGFLSYYPALHPSGLCFNYEGRCPARCFLQAEHYAT